VNDEILNIDEIYIQDIICSTVADNPKADDFVIYNKIMSMIDILTIEETNRILDLIKLNKIILIN
jgi:hypothetical protein